MGKIITKNKIIAAAAIIMAASAGSAAVFQSRTANVALADDAITISEDIYRESGTGGFFDSAAVHQLYNALTKNENLDKDAEFSDVETMVKGGAKSVDDFGEIYLTFGGIRWTAVYLSQTRDSKIALTLLEADEDSTSNYWQTGYTSVTYTDVAVPANMYSTSYMRAVALNAGGEYATGQKTSASAEQKENNRYARFTMEDIPNSLTKYLFTPSQIDWQEKESARVISKKSVVYDRSNEAYGSVENTNFYKGTFGEGTTNYSNWKSSATTSGEGVTVTELTNGAWQNDYVWLPSATELGEKTNSTDTTYDGKWHIKDSQRNFGGKEYWTRSAYHASPAMAVYFDWDGTSKSAPVKEMRNVRACIHLNLPQAEDESQVIVTTPQIFDENGVDTQRTGYNGASISQVLGNAPNGDYTQSFNFFSDSQRSENVDGFFNDNSGHYYNPIIYNGTDRLFGVRAGEMAHVASFTLSAASEPGEEATYTRQSNGSYAAFAELSSIKYVNEASNARTNWNKSGWDSDGKDFVGYFTAKNADTYTVKFTLETDTEKVRYCWSSSYKHEDLTYTLQIGKRPLAIEVEDAKSVYGEEVNLNQTKGEGWKVIGLDFADPSEKEFVTLNTNATQTSAVGENYAVWARFAYDPAPDEDHLIAKNNYSIEYRGKYAGGSGYGTDGTQFKEGEAGAYKITAATIQYGSHAAAVAGNNAVLKLKENATYQNEKAVQVLDDGTKVWGRVAEYRTSQDNPFSYEAILKDDVTNTEEEDVVFNGDVMFGTITYTKILQVKQEAGNYSYEEVLHVDGSGSESNRGVKITTPGDFIVFVTVNADNHEELNGLMFVHITSADIRFELKTGLKLTYEYGHFGSTAALNGEKISFEELSIPDAANLPDPDSDTLIKLFFNTTYITNVFEIDKETGTAKGDTPINIQDYLDNMLGKDKTRISITFDASSERSASGHYAVKEGIYLSIAWVSGESDERQLSFATKDGDPIQFINITPYTLDPDWGTTEFTYDGAEHLLKPTVENGSGEGQKFFDDDVEFKLKNVGGKDAGTYTEEIINLTGADANNYVIAEDKKTCSFTISQKKLTIVAIQQTAQYDGKDAKDKFKATNGGDTDFSAYNFVDTPVDGEKVQITLALVNNIEDVIHAGLYNVRVADWMVSGENISSAETAKNNYVIEIFGQDENGYFPAFTITSRSLSITLAGHENTYGDEHTLNDRDYWQSGKSDEAHGFTFNSTTLLDTDEGRVRVALYYEVDGVKRYVYGSNDGKFDGVGDYDIKAELWYLKDGASGNLLDENNWQPADGSEDYVLNEAYVPATLKITPRPATITVDEYTVTYGDVKSDTLTSVLEGAENEIVVFDGFINGEEPTVTLSLSDADGKYSDAGYLKAGEYSFTVAHSYNENYTITVVTNEKFVVNKLTLQLEVNTSDNSCKTTYGEEPDFAGVSATATGEKGFPVGEEPNFTFYLSAEQGGEKAEKLVITAENGSTYYLCAEIADNPNYIFTFSGEAVKWTITPKDITVQLGGGTSVYGEDPDFSGITKECTDLVENDSVEDLGLTLSISEPKDGTYYNAGNYTLTGESTNPNYNVSFAGGNYEITKKPITVAATSFTLEYGNEPTEDNDKFTIQSGGLVSGDSRGDLAITLSISKIKIDGEAPEPHWNVGEYAITGESTSKNYEVTIEAGTLKITPRNIFIYIANAGTPYGADLISETNLEDYAKVMESSPLASWDINTSLRDLGITFSVAGTSGSYPVAVGTYAIEGMSVSQNYNVTFFGAHSDGKAGAYTVSVLTGVVIQLGSFSDVYGSSNPDLTNNKWWTKNGGQISYPAESGVTELDDKFLGIELEIVGEADPKEAGSYTIRVKSTNPNPNIICTSTDGTYTITPKPIKVTVKNVEQVYGADEVDLSDKWSVSEETPLAYGEEKEVLGVTLTRDKGGIVGGYAIHGTATTKNYEITFNEANYTITPRPVTVTVKKATSAYGDPLTISDGYATPAQYEVEEFDGTNNTGLVEGDSLRVQLKILGIDTPPTPGTYEIVAKGDNGNYTFTFKMQGGVETVNTDEKDGFVHFGGGEGYEVTKRELRLAITSTSSYYGEKQAELSVSIASGYSLAEADRGNDDLVEFFGLELAVYRQNEDSPAEFGELTAGVYEIKGTQPTEKLNFNADYYTLTFVPGVYTILQLDSVVVRLNTVDLSAIYGTISAGSKLSELTGLAGAYKVTRDDNNSPWKVSTEGFDAFQSGFVEGWLENLLTVEFNGNDNADKQNAYDALLSFTLNLTVSISTDNWYGGKEGTYYLGVGNYAISGTVAEESIVVSVLPGTLRITPKKITVNTPSVGVDELLYYGDDDRAIPTASEEMVEGLLPGDYLKSEDGNIGLDIVFSRAAGTDADDYAITGSYNANQLNYTVTFNKGTYKITPREVKVTITAQKQVYGDYTYSGGNSILTPVWSAPDLSAGDVFTMTFELTDAAESLSNDRYLDVGKYTIKFTFAAGETSKATNYKFTFIYNLGEENKGITIEEGALIGTVTDGYEVTPRPITITFSNVVKYYGTVTAGADGVFDELNDTNKWLVTGLASDSDIDEIFGENAQVFSVEFGIGSGWVPAGTYEIEKIGTSTANYNVTFNAPDFIVEKTAVTFRIGTMPNKTYGEAAEALDEVWTAVKSSLNDGTGYKVTGAHNAVEFRYNNNLFLTVTFPEEFDFTDETALTNFIASLSPFSFYYTDADGREVLPEQAQKIAAGQYGVRLREGENKNYTVSVQNGALLVKPKEVTVVIGEEDGIGLTAVYGTDKFAKDTTDIKYWHLEEGSALAFEDTKEGLQITLTRELGSDAKDYIVNGVCGNPNYTVNFEGNIYTITPKEIEVTINDVSSTYGDTPELTYELADGQSLVDGDRVESLGIILSLLLNGNPATLNNYNHYNVATYTITGTSSNPNYTVKFSDATFTVTKREINATVKDVTVTYGDGLPAFSFTTPDSFPSGESYYVLNVDYRVEGTINGRQHYDAGKYKITATNSNPNYNVTFTEGKGYLTVTARKITITIPDILKTYGDATNNEQFRKVDFTCAGSFASSEDKEILNVTFTLEGIENDKVLDAGTYALVGHWDNDNYEITFVGNYNGEKGLVTVSPKTVQVELKDITVLYGSTPADSVFDPKNVIAEGSMEGESLRGLVNDDIWDSDTGIKFKFSVKTETPLANLDYGAYQLIAAVSGARSKNYNFVFSQANYFVCAVGLNVFLYNVDEEKNIYGEFENGTFDEEYKNGAEKIDIIYFDPSDPDQSRLEGKIPAASEFTYSIADYKEEENLAVGRHSIVAAFTRTVNYNVTIIPGTYIVYPAPIEVTIEFNEPNALARAASDKYSKVYDGQDVTLDDVKSNSEDIKIKDGEMVGEDVLTFTLTKAPGANAGDYVIVIALKNDPSNVLLASNYHITYGTGTYRILPRPVTVEITNQTAQYGSVALNSDIDMWRVAEETEEGKGLADGEQNSVLGVRLSLYNEDEPVTDTALAGLTVGRYAIVGSSTNGNYEVTFTGSYDGSDAYRGKAGLFQVTGREVTIYAESGSSVYGEAVTLPSWHLGNESSVLSNDVDAFRSNLTVAIEGYSEGKKLSVNEYDVTVTYNKEKDVYANYSITVVNGTYTVTRRPVTVSVDSITETFGANLDGVLGKVTSQVSGNVEGDDLKFTYSVLKDGQPYNGTTDPIPTGTYVLHAELAAESEELGKNYSINYSDGSLFIVNSNGIVVIVKSSVLTSVYGDALVDLDALNSDKTGYEVMGANGAELGSIKVTLSYVESVKQNIKNVGTYEGAVDAKVEGVGENVTIVKGTYTVTPKSITVTIDSEISQVYGEEGIILTDKWSVSSETPLAYEETQDVLGVTLTRAPGDAVGTYAISGTWDNGNYTVTFTKADYTITHRPITVRTKDAKSTYGDPLAALTAEVLTGDGSLGLKEEEDISVLNLVLEIVGEWSTYLPYKEGGYQIICRTSGTVGNYDITVQNTGTYTVKKREVTLAANNTSGIYGTDTASIPFTYSITSGELAYGEQISVEFSLKDHGAEERLQVGNYIIECQITGITSSYSGYTPTLDNYEIKLENGEYEVTPRTASVVIYKQGYSYGEDAFDTAEGTAYTVSGLLDGDNLNLSFKRLDGEDKEVQIFNVGTYRITGDYDNDNYYVQFSEGVYEISKRILEVQIDNKSSIYGDLPATLTYRLNGSLVEGDSEQDLGIVLSLSGTSLPAGNYDITGTYNSDKYDVRFINGRYTVEKRTVEVQIEDKTSFYGEPLVPLTCILLGELPAGDEIDDLKIVLSLPEGALNAGSYLITGTSDNDNYTVVFHNGVYLISRASNRWDTRFSVSEWMEGDEVGDMVAPEAKYGDAIVRYFTDSACTQEYEGDIKDAKAGTYYAQVYVEDSENYSGLAPTVYEFHIKSMPSVGAFAVLSVVEVVAFAALLWVAVHFGKKKRK